MYRTVSIQLAILILCGAVFLNPASAMAQAVPVQTTDNYVTPTTFLDKAIEMNRAEIHFGHLAITNAKDSHVKDFAAMLVKDHSEALHRLLGIQGMPSTDVMRQKPDMPDMPDSDEGIAQLTREHREAIGRLSTLSGSQFDRAFMELVVREHKTAIQFFEREAKESSAKASPEQMKLSSFAHDSLATLRQHLKQAESIQHDLSK